MNDCFDWIADTVGGRLAAALSALPASLKEEAQEICLRAGRPPAVVTARGSCFPDGRGGAASRPTARSPAVSAADLADALRRFCGYSVYACQEQLREGYLTLRGGHRVGVAGTAVMQRGELVSVRDISSLNIRIAREARGCSGELLRRCLSFPRGGLLLAGPPASGKTTLLRDLARKLGSGETGRVHKVAVVDERGEIAACLGGVPQFDVGLCTDVLSSCPKAEGILLAVRSLSPAYILCDELGGAAEAAAAVQGCGAGAAIVTTIHAGTWEELIRRPQTKTLLETGAFDSVALLRSREEPGRLAGWRKAGDLLAEIRGARAARGSLRVRGASSVAPADGPGQASRAVSALPAERADGNSVLLDSGRTPA